MAEEGEEGEKEDCGNKQLAEAKAKSRNLGCSSPVHGRVVGFQ